MKTLTKYIEEFREEFVFAGEVGKAVKSKLEIWFSKALQEVAEEAIKDFKCSCRKEKDKQGKPWTFIVTDKNCPLHAAVAQQVRKESSISINAAHCLSCDGINCKGISFLYQNTEEQE